MKFRWGYVGNGNIAKSTAKSILKGNHTITAVYGRNKEKAESFATAHSARAYADYDEMIAANDIDGIYIATPHTSHLDYAVRAMKAGKPVLCEKPVAVCEKDVQTLIDCSKDNGVYFCEAMWTWFSDVALTVKKWVQSGEIGDVKSVVINYAFPGLMMSKNSRVLTPSTAGGALLDIGIYPITYCYNLFGYPDKIECDGVIKNGIDVKETVTLYYGEIKCTLNMALDTLKENCVIEGTDGKIAMGFFHMASKATLKNKSGKQVFRGKTDYLTEFTHVAEEIKSVKTESDYIPHTATLECMRIMDECRRQMKLVYPFEEQK
ncbi:MAG: Gfo/Idh/MocA family oxidoreductase [Ruminococcaceae bacterium]|nr:Gfo/Idh/MocA family oxidoreductase [Oscillospiraceae bacterium]